MITYCPRCGAQYREEPGGEWLETSARCVDCRLAVTAPPAMLARSGSGDDEVEYDLAEWDVPERGAATTALLEAEIPYRWEPDLILVGPAVGEDEVDRLLEDLDEVEEAEDDGGIDGGEEAQSAMADLFVAADRLQHAPADADLARDVVEATTTVRACLPPYGIDRPLWRQIQGLASTLVGDLEDSAEEEVVAEDARAVREFLRDYV